MALIPAIYQSSTDQAFLILLTITPGTGAALHVVNNLEPITSRGQVFEPYPFSVVLAGDDGDKQPSVSVVIDAVDGRVIEMVRAMLTPPDVKLELILSGSPDTVDKTLDFLRLSNVQYDALTVTGTLEPVDFLSLPAVDSIYSGNEFPDLLFR